MRYADTQFIESGIAQAGISPAPFRQRLWECETYITRTLLARHQITALAAPCAGHTDAGFLAPKCSALDATHANIVYGQYTLDMLNDHLRASE